MGKEFEKRVLVLVSQIQDWPNLPGPSVSGDCNLCISNIPEPEAEKTHARYHCDRQCGGGNWAILYWKWKYSKCAKGRTIWSKDYEGAFNFDLYNNVGTQTLVVFW